MAFPMARATWVPMGAQIHVLSPNDHPYPYRGRNSFGKSSIFKIFQVLLDNLNNGNFRLLGNQWPGQHRPSRKGVSLGVQEPVLSQYNSHRHPSQGRQKGLGKTRSPKFYCLSAMHLKERPNQSVSQASRQADRQTETHSLGFFSGGLGYKQRGSRRVRDQPASER